MNQTHWLNLDKYYIQKLSRISKLCENKLWFKEKQWFDIKVSIAWRKAQIWHKSVNRINIQLKTGKYSTIPERTLHDCWTRAGFLGKSPSRYFSKYNSQQKIEAVYFLYPKQRQSRWGPPATKTNRSAKGHVFSGIHSI